MNTFIKAIRGYRLNATHIYVFLIFVAVCVLSIWYFTSNFTVYRTMPLNLSDLPKEAVFIPHPEDEKEAERLGKIAMKHYATPKDAKNGGPIYGSYGYGVVAIEYEIPLADLGIRAVGDELPGKLLDIPEIQKFGKNIDYDHFHIGISQHSHNEAGGSSDHAHTEENELLIIHFMLISHDKEEVIGLYCG